VARTVVLLEDHTDAVLTLLRTSTIEIGDGVIPRNADKSVKTIPFAALYPLLGGDFDGPLSDTQADVSLMYQITSVGETRQQAQIVLDILRVLMADRSNFLIPNRAVRDVRLLTPFSGIVRDDDLPNPVFYGYDRYELDTTPA
jgi:hypothetical protein